LEDLLDIEYDIERTDKLGIRIDNKIKMVQGFFRKVFCC